MRHALLKRVIRVLLRVVMMRVPLRHLRISAVERLCRTVAVVAVMMIRHVGLHVRLIVVQIDRLRLHVVVRPVVVIIRGSPRHVGWSAEHIP
jgi:hypothetical protein